MAKRTPTEIAEKQIRRTKGAIEDMRIGIQNVEEAPTMRAAKKIDKMRMNLMEAFDDGRVKRGLERVTKEDWQQSMLTKGINNIGAGLDNARGKIERFQAELQTYQTRLLQEIEKMPDTTFEDRLLRQSAWARGMHKFRKSS